MQEYLVFSARIPYSQSGQLVLASYRHVGEDFSFHNGKKLFYNIITAKYEVMSIFKLSPLTAMQ